MTYTLPDASTANTESNATLAERTTTANAQFIASATVLINNATANSLFQVEPFVVPFMSIATITTYFQGLGYTVTYPIVPNYPWNWCGIPAGFPEVVPNGWTSWACGCGNCEQPRISITWPPFPVVPPYPCY